MIATRRGATVVPVMNGHPQDQAKVSVHCRWPLIRGNLSLKCVGRGIDNVAVQGRWPLMTGVAQGRYYSIFINVAHSGRRVPLLCLTKADLTAGLISAPFTLFTLPKLAFQALFS